MLYLSVPEMWVSDHMLAALKPSDIDTRERLNQSDLELARRWGSDHARHLDVSGAVTDVNAKNRYRTKYNRKGVDADSSARRNASIHFKVVCRSAGTAVMMASPIKP
jgi:hypothetical protein